MNTEHKDINKILPYGEQLRGFINQKYITSSELNRILRERGIFVFNSEKEYTVPLFQTLILSPREFDKIRDAFSTREDNKKVNSSGITWDENAQILQSNLLSVDVDDFIRRTLPTCALEKPIRFTPVNSNTSHLKAEISLRRNDRNKSWYEQTNIFEGAVEFINDGSGKGRIVVTHTSSETKELAEFVVKSQIDDYKKKGIISMQEKLRKILFKDFSNEERFSFFFQLIKQLKSVLFKFKDIKDIAIRPDGNALPEEIKWMDELNKIVLSGKALDKKNFISDKKFHSHLIFWNIDAAFAFSYGGQSGIFNARFGFPDFPNKGGDAEFELTIFSLNSQASLDVRTKKLLRSALLSEVDKQKSIVYNEFLLHQANRILNTDKTI